MSATRSRSRSRSRGRVAKAAVYDEDVDDVQQQQQEENDVVEPEKKTARRGGAGGFHVRVIHAIMLYVGGGTLGMIYLHYRQFAYINIWQSLLALFLVLNTFICVAEISMNLNASYVREQSEKFEKKYEGRLAQVAVHWFTLPLTLRNVFGKAWAEMFASYAVYDPSYANDSTYSFWVDSGNGFFTLLPSLLLLAGMTYDLEPYGVTVKALGLLSFVTFWTELYGTILYAWSFFYHRRQQKIGWPYTFLFVFLTNGIWFVVPLIGMWLSVEMIHNGNMARFHFPHFEFSKAAI